MCVGDCPSFSMHWTRSIMYYYCLSQYRIPHWNRVITIEITNGVRGERTVPVMVSAEGSIGGRHRDSGDRYHCPTCHGTTAIDTMSHWCLVRARITLYFIMKGFDISARVHIPYIISHSASMSALLCNEGYSMKYEVLLLPSLLILTFISSPSSSLELDMFKS